ncbi:MAG: hypothetical protein M3Z01_07155 [Thermoproteota archaeon]|nr:hypothetical protein [Thermoproteota archaeon]
MWWSAFYYALIHASFKKYPSFCEILVDLFANPVSNSAFANQLPEPSPVNILPVLLPP